MKIDRVVRPATTFDEKRDSAIIGAEQAEANARGAHAVDFQKERTNTNQVAGGARCFIGNGANNIIGTSGSSASIVAGQNNGITSTSFYSFIGGGDNNQMSGTGNANAIVNGINNTISGSSNSCFIGSGAGCAISGTSGLVSILGGQSNACTGGLNQVIVGGNTCSITAGEANVLLGGLSNTMAGFYSTIGGGSANAITGDFNCILNGISNSIATGGVLQFVANLILSGNNNSIGAGRTAVTIINGQNNTAEQDYSTVINGQGAKTTTKYEVAWGGQAQGADIGSVQNQQYILSMDTTTASATRMSIDGTSASATNQINIPTDRTISMNINIVAMEKRGDGSDSATFQRKVLIQNLNGTTAIVGSVQTIGTDIGSNSGSPPTGWAVAITADNTVDALNISVTGAASTNVRWVARIDATQVGWT